MQLINYRIGEAARLDQPEKLQWLGRARTSRCKMEQVWPDDFMNRLKKDQALTLNMCDNVLFHELNEDVLSAFPRNYYAKKIDDWVYIRV